MASSINTSINAALDKHISNTNLGIQRISSIKSIPLWINPNNGNFYVSNPYKAGDIVILLSDKIEIYDLLSHYFENISSNIGVDSSFFYEKNNPELKSDIANVLINGGYIIEDEYINPMTIVSTSEKGYGLYVSLKNQNYDIPGASDSWFNLDMSESLDAMQLQLSRIISILTSDGYISKLTDSYVDPISEKEYSEDVSYLDNRLTAHKVNYHFGDSTKFDQNVEKAFEKLNKIQAEIESNENTTTSIMRNPFILNGEIVGNSMTIKQTTGQMFFYCILDATKFNKDEDITINFMPGQESNIIIPIVLKTNNGGIITVTNPETDDCVKTETGDYAWCINSYVKVSNEANATNNITIETNYGFEDANFNNNFNGFIDDSYIASYTPIGSEIRQENIAIHCSPIKEISRTNTSMVIQLSSKYVWKYTAIAIALSGKCEVNS